MEQLTESKTRKIDTGDMVNHPPHYTDGEVECIEAIKSSMSTRQYLGYLKGNIMKYIWRFDKKGNADQDLEKAIWYLNRMLDVVTKDRA